MSGRNGLRAVAKEIKFPLGQVVMTPGAMLALEQVEGQGVTLGTLLRRHLAGDWGELDEEDKRENDYSVPRHLRILSAYRLPTGRKVWVITEADRSLTTILLPEEY